MINAMVWFILFLQGVQIGVWVLGKHLEGLDPDIVTIACLAILLLGRKEK